MEIGTDFLLYSKFFFKYLQSFFTRYLISFVHSMEISPSPVNVQVNITRVQTEQLTLRYICFKMSVLCTFSGSYEKK